MTHNMLYYLHRMVYGIRAAKGGGEEESAQSARLEASLEQNLQLLRERHSGSSDIVIREFMCGYGRKAAIVYVDGMVSSSILSESVMKPLLLLSRGVFSQGEAADFNVIRERIITAGEIEETDELDTLITGYLSGGVAVLLDGFRKALVVSCKGWEKRAVTEPETEAVVRGPREGFTENIRTNTALLRRKIKDSNLIFETQQVGEKTNTTICISYLKGVADPHIIELVRKRIAAIKTDSILESGYIEQFIEDNPFSIFPQLGSSEKPDIVAAKMLEGRVAILVDGTPFVLTAPALMVESFQSPEDYYVRPFFSSIVRLLRYLSFSLSILAPALYVALTTYHQELLPTVLLFTMTAAREGIPFPAVFEAFIMVITFEILREAGLRLPRPVGQAISIVGALVLGEAAVSAGIIGAPMVIVVAITAVSGFVVPSQTDVITILRFVMLALAGFMGGIGIMAGIIFVVIHLCRLKSFGVPYLAPFAPLQKTGLKDSVVRSPLWVMLKRPESIAKDDVTRGKFMIPPGDHPSGETEVEEGE